MLSLSSPGGMLALPGVVLFQVFHFMALPVKSCKVDPCQSVFPEKCLGGFGSHVHDVVCAPRAEWLHGCREAKDVTGQVNCLYSCRFIRLNYLRNCEANGIKKSGFWFTFTLFVSSTNSG